MWSYLTCFKHSRFVLYFYSCQLRYISPLQAELLLDVRVSLIAVNPAVRGTVILNPTLLVDNCNSLRPILAQLKHYRKIFAVSSRYYAY